jgi:hypothetical protein
VTRRSLFIAAIVLATAAPAMAQGGGGGRRGGGFGAPGGGGGLFMLMIPEVQKELKLEETQVELLRGLFPPRGEGRRGGFGEDFRNLSPEEQQKRIAAFRAEQEKQQAEQEKKIAEILDAKQNTRYKQLKIQQAGIRAIGQKDIATSLKLSADQQSKVAAALAAEDTARREMFAGFRGGGDGQRPDIDAIRQKMTDLRTSTDAKLNAVLTMPQKTSFTAMQGAAFKFPEGGGFGRRGGRRGGNNNNN